MTEYTPQETVRELDRFIVRQDRAKKSVAIALRNRWRRQQVPRELRDEIVPNNIIMIGPTGVGKTEIARRLARLVSAPFVKVEATNYTEVGYMGRDVESIIRDLVEISVTMVMAEQRREVAARAQVNVEERLVDLLLSSSPPADDGEEGVAERRARTRSKLRDKLRSGEMENRVVTLRQKPQSANLIEIFSRTGLEDFNISMPNAPGIFNPSMARGATEKEVTVSEARSLLQDEEAEKLLDTEQIHQEAKERAQANGIVFVDEIDKIAVGSARGSGPDVSREGVQRDLLPIVEGCAVNTRYGVVRTDHILFIAAGAFNISKPSDLIPEFQGRFPIRVELDSLTQEDFERILREPDASLIKQYTAMVAADGCKVAFDPAAVKEIARVAFEANEKAENIGARRLQTVMATLMEPLLFELPESERRAAVFTAEDVHKAMDKILSDEDLAKYIL